LRRFFCIASGRLIHAIRSGGRRFAIFDAIDSTFVRLLGNKVEPEFLADDTGKKAAHRMLLPIRGSHDPSDRCARRRSQHCDDAGVFGVGARCRLE
jgi:hypothetical protein